MKLRLLIGSLAALLTVVACSGADDTSGLFAAADDSSLDADPSAQEQRLPGTTSPPSSRDGADSGATKPGKDPKGPEDAGSNAPPPPSGDDGISCGASPCTAGSELCCLSRKNGGKVDYRCEANALFACGSGTAIACDDDSDCPSGQVCCGALLTNRYASVECKAACNDSFSSRAVRFCDPNAATDVCAALGASCLASQTLPGYYVCTN